MELLVVATIINCIFIIRMSCDIHKLKIKIVDQIKFEDIKLQDEE